MYVTVTLALKDDDICCYLYCQCSQPLTFGVPAVVTDQNALTASVLDECETRQQFNKLLTELYDYPRYSCPRRHGKRCILRPFLPFYMQPLHHACSVAFLVLSNSYLTARWPPTYCKQCLLPIATRPAASEAPQPGHRLHYRAAAGITTATTQDCKHREYCTAKWVSMMRAMSCWTPTSSVMMAR